MFFGKRERIMKCGWRHGIVGVEDVDTASPNSTSFYKEQQHLREQEDKNKDIINKYREKSN